MQIRPVQPILTSHLATDPTPKQVEKPAAYPTEQLETGTQAVQAVETTDTDHLAPPSLLQIKIQELLDSQKEAAKQAGDVSI